MLNVHWLESGRESPAKCIEPGTVVEISTGVSGWWLVAVSVASGHTRQTPDPHPRQPAGTRGNPSATLGFIHIRRCCRKETAPAVSFTLLKADSTVMKFQSSIKRQIRQIFSLLNHVDYYMSSNDGRTFWQFQFSPSNFRRPFWRLSSTMIPNLMI